MFTVAIMIYIICLHRYNQPTLWNKKIYIYIYCVYTLGSLLSPFPLGWRIWGWSMIHTSACSFHTQRRGWSWMPECQCSDPGCSVTTGWRSLPACAPISSPRLDLVLTLGGCHWNWQNAHVVLGTEALLIWWQVNHLSLKRKQRGRFIGKLLILSHNLDFRLSLAEKNT